jgi:hypothetical protein
MASDVEIANNALSMLGDDPITSLTDDTPRARLVNRIYPQTRDAVLRSHPWNCATSRATLGQLSTSPVYGWAYQYQLPSDPYCLRVLALNDREDWACPGDEFKVEGRALLTDAASANIRYIFRITDPAQYDAMLYEALSAKLASKMAYAITKSQSTVKAMLEIYDGILRETRTIDGQEGSPDKQDNNILTQDR